MNWVLLVMALVVLGINANNAYNSFELRKLQMEVQRRETLLSQGSQYRSLNQQLIQALAGAAANTGDEAIRQMLSSEGVTFTVNPAEADAAEAPGEDP